MAKGCLHTILGFLFSFWFLGYITCTNNCTAFCFTKQTILACEAGVNCIVLSIVIRSKGHVKKREYNNYRESSQYIYMYNTINYLDSDISDWCENLIGIIK